MSRANYHRDQTGHSQNCKTPQRHAAPNLGVVSVPPPKGRVVMTAEMSKNAGVTACTAKSPPYRADGDIAEYVIDAGWGHTYRDDAVLMPRHVEPPSAHR
jgi:hypothetical protein